MFLYWEQSWGVKSQQVLSIWSHSPQLSFPQHLDKVKHLADPDKIQQAFAAGFGRKPQWILAHLKAVRSELGLVKKGHASCNLRLLLTIIYGLCLAWKQGIPKSQGSAAAHDYRESLQPHITPSTTCFPYNSRGNAQLYQNHMQSINHQAELGWCSGLGTALCF